VRGAYGNLVPADETLNHQIVDTFGTVSQSDPSWTEKVWAIGHARDASLQIVFGLGKYTNRGVYESAAGVCRGTDQWTVRGARPLWPGPDAMSTGPLHYEIVEPLQRIRCVLEPNEAAPISFDVTWIGTCPVSLETPWPDRTADSARVTHDILRYHQTGVMEGWVEVEGERTEITPESWISIRDHSWGLRPGVGEPIAGAVRGRRPSQTQLTWMPAMLERPDGSEYSLFAFVEHAVYRGVDDHKSQAEEVWPDGRRHSFAAVVQDLQFEDANRRLIGGTITLIDTDGSTRPLTIKPVSSTGFHLGTGGYFGWDGRPAGMFTKEPTLAGEKISNCDDPVVARRVHQLRDLLVHIDDPIGGGSGLANIETLIIGAFPEKGLTLENTFL
jgi:hypothetical protein